MLRRGTRSFLAMAILLTMLGCSSSRSDLSFSKCNAYQFSKTTGEADLLRDAQKLIETPGVAMVEDRHLGKDGFLIVHCSPGMDLPVRKAVVDLGYQSVAVIPEAAVAGSHAMGLKWFVQPHEPVPPASRSVTPPPDPVGFPQP